MDECDRNACPRCEACTRDFIRVINLEDIGLVVYKYTKKAKDMQKDIGVTVISVKVDDEMYIILSNKNTDVKSQNFMPNIEQISCPRCRQIMNQSLKHIQNVTAAQKNTITGVCEHCKLKAQAQSRCGCKELIKCFIRTYDLDKWNKELVDELRKTEINKEPKHYNSTTFIQENLHLDQFSYQDYTTYELGSSNPLKGADRLKVSHEAEKLHQEDEVVKSKYSSEFKTHGTTKRNIKEQEFEQGSSSPFKDADRFIVSHKGEKLNQNDEIVKSKYSSGIKTHGTTKRNIIEQELEQRSSSPFKDADRFKVFHKGEKFHQDDEAVKFKYSSGIKTHGKTKRNIKEQELEQGSSSPFKDADRFKVSRKGEKLHQNDEVVKSKYSSGIKTHGTTKRNIKEQELEQRSSSPFKDANRFKVSHKGEKLHQDDEVVKSKYSSGIKTHGTTKRNIREQELDQRSSSPFKDADRFKVSHKGEKLHQDDEVVKSKYSSGIKTHGITNRIIKEQKGAVSPKTVKKMYSSELNKNFKTKYDKDNNENKEIKKTGMKDGVSSEKKSNRKEVVRSNDMQREKVTDKNKHERNEKQARNLKTKQISTHGTDELSKKKGLDSEPRDVNEKKNTKRILQPDKFKDTGINKAMMLEAQKENKLKKTLEELAQKMLPKKDDIKDISISKIKMMKNSQDNVVVLSHININSPTEYRLNKAPELPMDSKYHNHSKWHRTWRDPYCIYCIRCSLDEKIEMTDIDSISVTSTKSTMSNKEYDIIVGEKILRRKPAYNNESLKFDKDNKPILCEHNFTEFATTYNENTDVLSHETSSETVNRTSGIIRYALSDRSFIENGWTVLPTEKIVRKLKVYRMRPARPEYNWFEKNKSKGLIMYDSGEKLAEFDDKGRGRWFYKNGRLALDYYDAEELNAKQRFVIFSNGEPDERGRPRPYTVLATFDYLGNGIVFDHNGKIRLKYNQTEGIVLDKNIGPFSRWKWHKLNDPPEFRNVVQDTVINKDTRIEAMLENDENKERMDDEMILEIEYNNLLKEKIVKNTQPYKPFQIRMKALKINEQFSLKVLDQATVYLIFRDGTTNLKLNIGMILDNKEIVDIDMTAEVEEVSNNVEILPARTDSIFWIQKHVENARRLERIRKKRDKKLFAKASSMSADNLTAATSRPIQYPLHTVHSCVATTETADCCY